ncbi:MAG TPA: bifunctional [glutamate--ammonia ligase]-adenylyl-L-tyrosine phosphorylase/[glutamate--ammonia-ligase] adenylyltransferase, partial [Polyangia bacterium]|nr:bifunctional [glutamate--ammonia ligase]-adenylyl-L-tyrosine phosphorylase/[glutamate--ammonia-ligase] adenylyltransferase [Polyangia bacterium]
TLFEALLASGSFLPELLLADVGALTPLAADPWLRRAKPPEVIAREVRAAAARASDLAGLQRRLRRVRRAEMLRLGARELGWGTTEEVARELSAFADVCLEVAVDVCDAELRRELGTPRADDGGPVRFVVMAMGKLGGEELNFSSDVDVCYFYSTDAGAAGEASLHHYYSELSRRVSAALEQLTADGMVFRVDLRLRPEGRNGPLCNSIAAAETYYETFGRTWERQAWLRARPAAGDRALGDELLAVLEPFIYPRSIDARLIDEVRGLRALFRDPADAGGALGETGFDVKLGAGGIRDVEMVVQALQLLHAGKRRDLRERNTPRALPRLVVAGLLGDREAWTLLSAYRFWRRLEHRVQVATGAQQHRLPADDDARARFAAGLGFPDLAAFDAEVREKRAAVEAIAATLGEPPAEMHIEAARLLDPMRDRVELERLATAAGFRDAEAAVDTLEALGARLPAALLAHAIASPDPDRALLHLRDLIWRSSDALMLLLREEPRLARMLGTLFGTSDRLAELLIRYPPMWDALVEGLGARVRTRTELRARLTALLAAATNDATEAEEGSLRVIRRFQAEETLRIGLHDVSGGLEPGEVTSALTDVAEVCVEQAIETTLPGMQARYGVPRAGLTVLGLGSLGAREMRYGSDLDLVFLFGGDGESTTGIDHREWFARASVRLISALEAMLEEGRLYHVDMRLRPSGEQGLLVTSWSAFDRYHHDEAAGWERVALLRARIVYSNEPPALRAEREAQLAGIAFDRPFDARRFVADLRRVRARVETERGRVPEGSRHLRFDPGGIMDVEFLVALGQLQHAADAGVRTTATADALARLVALGWPESLLDDHGALRRATLRLRLLLDRPQDVLSPRDLPMLARSLGTTPDTLAADLDARMARIRAVFDERFG